METLEKYQIVKANLEHVEEITALWVKLMETHRRLDATFFERWELEVNRYKSSLKSSIKSSDEEVFVLLVQEKVVGYVTARIVRYGGSYSTYNQIEFCEVGDIMIEGQYRRNGFGEQLIEAVREWARKFKVSRMELYVFSKNTIGRSFFKKAGFKDNFHVVSMDV